MTLSDTARAHREHLAFLAEPVPAFVQSEIRSVVLPRCLAMAARRDPTDPQSASVVRVVPREHLVQRRVYVYCDADGWPIYVGSSTDELRRLHEHEARIGAEPGGTWAWFPAPDAWTAEEGLIRLLRPLATKTRAARDGRYLPPTAAQIRAMREAGLAV